MRHEKNNTQKDRSNNEWQPSASDVKIDTIEIWNLIKRIGIKGDTTITWNEILYLEKHRIFFSILHNKNIESFDSLKLKSPSDPNCYYALHKYKMLCRTPNPKEIEYYLEGMDGELRVYRYVNDTFMTVGSLRK